MRMTTIVETNKVDSGRVLISTVLLPVGLQFSQKYETMVFEAYADKDEVKHYNDLGMNSYSNEQDAIFGHSNMVDKWRGSTITN